MVAPQIFFASGMFAGSAPFETCEEGLQKEGFTTRLGLTVTTNTKSPGNPTIADNLARYRDDITRFVEDAGEAEIIVVIHSAAGHYCSGALKDLSVQQRKAAEKLGGVAHLVFIAAIIAEEGNPEDLTPKGVSVENLEAAGVLSVVAGQTFINNPLDLFFNDLPQDQAQVWANKVYPEPTQGWERPITYMGWRDIPSHYIVCERDNLIPASTQEQLGKLAGSSLIRMDAGHFPQLSQPAELTKIIQQIASELK